MSYAKRLANRNKQGTWAVDRSTLALQRSWASLRQTDTKSCTRPDCERLVGAGPLKALVCSAQSKLRQSHAVQLGRRVGFDKVKYRSD